MESYKRNSVYKRNAVKRIVVWLACAVCLITVSSCAYRMTDEDWEKNGKVRLLLRWQTSVTGTNMRWYFYPEGSEIPVIRTGEVWGYEGTLPSGRYRVAVCNMGSTGVTLEMGKGYEEACGRAQQLSSLKSGPVQVACPGNLYGTGSGHIQVVGGETVARELPAVNLVRRLDMNIKIIGGGKGEFAPAVLSGRLTGVSSRVHIPSGKPLFDMPAFMRFEPEEVRPGVYSSSLGLFGLSGGGEGEERVALSLTLALGDGKEATSSTDITEEVKDAFTATIQAHVILDLVVRYDELGGLTVTLTDWKPGSDGSGVVTP